MKLVGEEYRYTPDELADELWANYPEYQYEVNREWLNGIFAMLKIDGIWAWPETGRFFKKISDEHFIGPYMEEEE